jgi:hypothetical protein
MWNGSAWGNSNLYTYTYDANNNQLTDLTQNWNGSAWQNISLLTHTYDANNFTLSETRKQFNNAGTEVITGDSIYYYFHDVLGINNLKAEHGDVLVYPNPFTNATTILFGEGGKRQLEVEDLTGRVLQQIQCSDLQYELERGNLAAGLYFIKVTDEYNKVSVSKILVQ